MKAKLGESVSPHGADLYSRLALTGYAQLPKRLGGCRASMHVSPLQRGLHCDSSEWCV
jgi:hypothetical protein